MKFLYYDKKIDANHFLPSHLINFLNSENPNHMTLDRRIFDDRNYCFEDNEQEVHSIKLITIVAAFGKVKHIRILLASGAYSQEINNSLGIDNTVLCLAVENNHHLAVREMNSTDAILEVSNDLAQLCFIIRQNLIRRNQPQYEETQLKLKE